MNVFNFTFIAYELYAAVGNILYYIPIWADK